MGLLIHERKVTLERSCHEEFKQMMRDTRAIVYTYIISPNSLICVISNHYSLT
ncbi:hypothetical protein Hanom_Chr09g00830001 [Helianthus anomalus]